MGYTGAVLVIVYATMSATDCNRPKTDSAGLGNSASAAWEIRDNDFLISPLYITILIVGAGECGPPLHC